MFLVVFPYLGWLITFDHVMAIVLVGPLIEIHQEFGTLEIYAVARAADSLHLWGTVDSVPANHNNECCLQLEVLPLNHQAHEPR